MDEYISLGDIGKDRRKKKVTDFKNQLVGGFKGLRDDTKKGYSKYSPKIKGFFNALADAGDRINKKK